MVRRSSPSADLEGLRQRAIDLLERFRADLERPDVRSQVRALVPAYYTLRDLGASLMPLAEGQSGRERIISYLRRYPLTVIDGVELLVVSGIDDWARRVRELRVEFGWWIYSGATLNDIAADPEQAAEAATISAAIGVDLATVTVDQYILVSVDQDRDAAHRWNTLNEIRNSGASVTDKILDYFRRNVGRPVTGEELKYLAKDRSEWPRRTRELRTEAGWPVKTKSSGRPDLPVGVYVLEADRQAPEHDRGIPDDVRVAVLQRDHFRCVEPSCGWNHDMASPADPRTMLELHHIVHHEHGGENTVSNLMTLCNVHHDAVHRGTLVVRPEWIVPAH